MRAVYRESATIRAHRADNGTEVKTGFLGALEVEKLLYYKSDCAVGVQGTARGLPRYMSGGAGQSERPGAKGPRCYHPGCGAHADIPSAHKGESLAVGDESRSLASLQTVPHRRPQLGI